MPASLPAPRPVDPRAERRVNELILLLLLAPLLAHGAQFGVKLSGGAAFAASRGAMAMLAGPVVFGIGLLALTRAHWAAWAAWAIELLLLLIVGVGDVLVAHALPARLAVAAVALPIVAWRIAGLQKLSPQPARPGSD
ncbi:MAG: hypothetical protein JST54_08610 [Deltaproteobacteria bacterium]|nr:hypothetical protein [Deltaproteobacteria bacterium]